MYDVFDMVSGALEKLKACEEYYTKLKQMEIDHVPANYRKETACVRCSVCCWRRPPTLTKDDLDTLALSFKLTPAEFFMKFCVVDEIAGVFGPVLIRAGQKESAGTWLSSVETFAISTPCIFLNDAERACILPIEVKPGLCAKYGCWSDETIPHEPWTKEELKALGWDGEQI